MKLNLHDIKIWIDLINLFVGLAIIAVALLGLSDSISGNVMFRTVYLLGFVMFLLNAVRSFKDRKLLTVIFLILAAVLAAGFVITVHGI